MRRLAALIALACVTSLGFGAALVLAGSKVGLSTTTTVVGSDQVIGIDDFTYDGQTISYSTWASGMGDASDDKLQYVQTPFIFDCAPGSLTVSAKKDFGGNVLDNTFTVGAGSDPAVPAGSVIVGVAIHSGNEFTVKSSEWVSDGAQVKIAISKNYSNAKVFYCTPVSVTTTTGPGGTTSISTIISTTTVTTTTTQTLPGTTVTEPAVTTTVPITVTISTPAHTVTAPGTTTVVTIPSGATTTVTIPNQTVTLPPFTETLPGETVRNPPYTVTQPGTTTTITAGTTTTVVTVTAPTRTVEGGVLASKKVVVTVTEPSHLVHLPHRIIHVLGATHTITKKEIVTILRACQAMGVGKG